MATHRRIVNVLILRIIGVALLLSFLTSAVLSWLYYREEQQRVAERLSELEQAEMPMLAAGVTASDRNLVEGHLARIEQSEMIRAVWLEDEYGTTFGRKITEAEPMTIELQADSGGGNAAIGTLSIVTDTEAMLRNVRRRSVFALAIQLGTVAVLAAVCYLIVHLSVIRHLLSIAGYMRRLDLEGERQALVLDRPARLTAGKPDELDSLTAAINDVLEHLTAAYERRQAAENELKGEYERSQELVRRQTEELRLANRLLSSQVSELQETRDELEAARHQEATVSRAKSDFLAMVSHEVRTPIAGIIGVVRLLLERKEIGAVHDHLEMILGSAIDLHQIVDDIVEYSRYEHEEPIIHYAPFSLCAAAHDSGSLYQYQASEHGTRITVDCAHDLPEQVVGDGERVRQILRNLVSNAVKFTRDGVVTIRVEPVRRNGEWIEVSLAVTDTGPGIPEEKLERLFSPYYQIEGPQSAKGSGLGLAISKQLAEYMGGTIVAASRLGEGSTFTVTVPFTIPSGAATGTDAASFREVATPHEADAANETTFEGSADAGGYSSEDAPSDAQLTILVAEDNGINRYYIRELLTTIGYRVVEAVDGTDALEKAKAESPALILMDVEMPEMNGVDATRHLRSDGDRVPVVALSAYEQSDLLERTAGSGFDAVLAKPVDEQKLFDLVEELTSRVGG